METSENPLGHWLCEECHHEWDGDDNMCDWCGAEGILLVRWEGFLRKDDPRVQ